jgi:hypothetical protein
MVGCGGSSGSGKALAQDAVKAIREQDQQKLEVIAERFEELGAAQKVRFATELAKHGEEMQAALEEFMKAVQTQ